jgi:hypothetical protein
MTWRGLPLIVISALATTALPEQGQVRAGLELEACSVPLTTSWRAAAFQGTTVYRVTTAATGQVESVLALKVRPEASGFIDLRAAEGCITRWRLEPSTSYEVLFSYGTTGPFLKFWKMRLSGGKLGVIELRLPLGDGSPKSP